MLPVPAYIKDLLRHSPLYRRLRREQIAREYHVSPEYYDALVRKSWKKRRELGLQAFRGWIEYGLTANRRSAWFMHFVHPVADWPNRRVLDVGCGFGGHCISAIQWGARSALGIDLTQYYIDLARINAFTHPNIDRFRLSFRVGDITDPAIVDELGEDSFDAIMIMDVLEHVKDIPATLEVLHRLLAPGGFVIAGVPNGRAASSVLADPHLGIFGLSLLEGDEAERVCQDRRNQSYDFMGTFPRLQDLCAAMEAWGATITILDDNQDPAANRSRLPAQLDEIARLAAEIDPADPLNGPIRRECEKYVAQVRACLDAPPASCPTEPDCYRDFVQHYWYIVARLPRLEEAAESVA